MHDAIINNLKPLNTNEKIKTLSPMGKSTKHQRKAATKTGKKEPPLKNFPPNNVLSRLVMVWLEWCGALMQIPFIQSSSQPAGKPVSRI